ncbi:hypothetical protein SPRG_10389 [Saprolegnia parasitica CBS 223.65]|uniref:PPM-type phosphatase domain-containing protein n=1 Tax=Saprolegnia parasitica (strain CBS 223.65) TaxID=695850 RepID=A0A067C0L6_SAPPC|nr:hypothetical protein SPRG_10389 [Saprolegnia parasitica CBS 223.65]KDO24314.1 hypothetical protein SPRG_10389 [Saprolegnia parasitica CBS 223.65]|eukprot:XP_012204911.1 hypothetical protein SPRG_10389 [Saprolegnia parasitica CBS 223.65]
MTSVALGKESLFLASPHVSFLALAQSFRIPHTPCSKSSMVAIQTPFTDLRVLADALDKSPTNDAPKLTSAATSWKSPTHENEDRSLVHHGDRYALFAVMDGHGGALASEYVKTHLVSVIDEQSEITKASLETAVATLEARFNQIAADASDYSGACFVALLVLQDGSHRRFVMNLGDCRIAALEVSPQAHPKRQVHALSTDHKASCPLEKRRILVAGGSVVGGRVAGVLAPSRSIGDIDMKAKGMEGWVVAVPEISEGKIARNSIYVLATDGVWDVLSNDEVLDIAEDVLDDEYEKNCQRASDAIAKEAVERGSRDDITAIVVRTS